MIEPVYSLLHQLAQGQRTGMLLLVITTHGSASHIVTIWLVDGELFHVSSRMRQGSAALLMLRHARLLRRWQWFELEPPPELTTQHLPHLQEFLDFEHAHVIPAPPDGAPVTLEQLRMERLFAIQTFMQTMAGPAGDDAFMQIVFDHSPMSAWDELVEALREHIGLYFGAMVARQVVDA